MNIEYLEKCAERYHIGTMAVVEKLVGLPSSMIKVAPFIAKKGANLIFYAPKGNVGIHPNNEYIHPYIMNGAFSLELKMKLLHAVETNSEMQGHNLSTLFGAMSDETKEYMREDIKQYVKNSEPHKDTIDFFKKEKIKFDWQLHKMIEKSSLVFERWRYIYEGKDDPMSFVGYTEIQHALNSRIADLRR